MKKKKKRIKKPKTITYPTQLNREDYFKCPIWFADAPEFEKKLNDASDKYIEASKKILKPAIDKRNKEFGDKGDMGHVFHSTSLIGDPNFLELQNQLEGTENRIKMERDRFNGKVNQYNKHIKVFPNSVLAGVFGFEGMDLYSSNPGSENAVEVNFDFNKKE